MKVKRASNNRIIEIDEVNDKIGQGGEGIAFKVGNDWVAKIYKKPLSETRMKIEAMLKQPPRDYGTNGHKSIAWPVDLLFDERNPHQFLGYLMPRVNNGVSYYKVAHFVHRQKVRPDFTSYHLHVIAANVAVAFRELHRSGYVIGDVNYQNIMINERGLATVIDTDSFQVPLLGGRGFYRCRVVTPDFTPPELSGVKVADIDRNEAHDLFGLGVLLFSILMQGFHPFTGVPAQGSNLDTLAKRIRDGNFPFGRVQYPLSKAPGAPSLQVLDPALQNLFIQCFDRGKRQPQARPKAAIWAKELRKAVKNMSSCRKNPNHLYSKHQSKCPWCEISAKMKLKDGTGLDFFPQHSSSQAPLPQTKQSGPATRRIVPKPPPSSFTGNRGKTPNRTSRVKHSAGKPTVPNTVPQGQGSLSQMLLKKGLEALGNYLQGGTNSPASNHPPSPGNSSTLPLPPFPSGGQPSMSFSGDWWEPNIMVRLSIAQSGNSLTVTGYDGMGNYFGQGQGSIMGSHANISFTSIDNLPSMLNVSLTPDGRQLNGILTNFKVGRIPLSYFRQ